MKPVVPICALHSEKVSVRKLLFSLVGNKAKKQLDADDY